MISIGQIAREEVAVAQILATGRDTSHIERDWRTWLKAVFPRDFSAPHAWFHEDLWDWVWDSLVAKRDGLPLPFGNTLFDIIFRGGGKSTHSRRAPIAEAALNRTGYCLYVSGTQKQANAHLAGIEAILGEPEILDYYPDLARVHRSSVTHESKGWRQDFIHTDRGYVFHAIGLDVGIRGANIRNMRPTMIVLDDADERNDSPDVAAKRLDTLLHSVLPTKTAKTLILSAQNLIHEHGIVNQIYEGQVRALLDRKVIGPVPAVEGLDTDARERPDGQIEDRIIAGVPTWPAGYGLDRAQEDINTFTLETFLSECQHDLTAKKAGRIMWMFDKDVHLITVSQFKAKFGMDTLPPHWERRDTHDVGYTGEKAHPGVFFSMGIAGENSTMAGTMFIMPEIFLGQTNLSPDYAAERYLERVLRNPYVTVNPDRNWTDEEREFAMRLYQDWLMERPNLIQRMSHEQLATRRVFEKYGMFFDACNPGASGGIPQLQHYHKVDYTKPHPFKADVMGRSNCYWVVADDQLEVAKNEHGSARGRLEVSKWRWRKEKLTETGLTIMKPMKAFDDFFNAGMMATHDMEFHVAGMSHDEQVEARLAPNLRAEAMAEQPYNEGREMARTKALRHVEREIEEEFHSEWEQLWANTV